MQLDRSKLDDLLDLVSTYRYHFVALAAYVVLIVAAFVYVEVSVMPQYEQQQLVIDEANKYHSEVTHMEASGLSSKELVSLAKALDAGADVGMFRDMAKLESAIAKPKTYKGDYLAWLSEELKLSDKRNAQIEENDVILHGILPTFVSANRNLAAKTERPGETLTLENFTQYIETNLLKRFGIESASAVGIDKIDFRENKAGTSNIGSFTASLDFQGDIRNVRKMLEFIQSSGRFVIRDGRLAYPEGVSVPTKNGLSENLLVNIVDFSVSGWLPPDDPALSDAPRVSGTLRLEFYVQGRSTQEVLLLRQKTMDDYQELLKKLKGYDGYCDKGSKCKTEEIRLAVAAVNGQYSFLFGYDDRVKAIKQLKDVTDVTQELNSLTLLQQVFAQVRGAVEQQEKVIVPSK